MSPTDYLDLTALQRLWAERRAALREILTRIDVTGTSRPARDADERAWLDERGEPRLTEDESMGNAAREYYSRRYRR